MECQMVVCTRDTKIFEGTSDLLSLPNELLVEIVSFLETRDKVKLRYVSRRLRSVSENTPSLWCKFVWPKYKLCEGQCLHNVMKACGVHIRQLSFPQHESENVEENILEMTKMLKYCSNLTHLSGLKCFLLNSNVCNKQLKETIEDMRSLRVLSISHCCSRSPPYLKLYFALKELNIFTRGCHKEDIEVWMDESFTVQTVNIVSEGGHNSINFLLANWPNWSSKIPAGHVVCVKLYNSYEVPLNLFQSAPVFQIQYGEATTFPFIQTSSIGVHNGYLQLTDHDNGSRMVHKGSLRQMPVYQHNPIWHHVLNNQLQLDDVLTNLTELDLSNSSDVDFKPIIVACPQLLRLNLKKNKSLRVEDLQMIATYCSKLQGLNLIGTLATNIKFCLEVWEILSSMKLTYLCIHISLVGIMIRIDDAQKKQLVTLFKQFVTLQALELFSERFYDAEVDYRLLSHFPSLQSCGLDSMEHSTCVKDILATCKILRCFRCDSSTWLLLSLQPHNNLQKLCISSKNTNLDDNFMDTVSAHGGLTCVVFLVRSVNSQGITTLIKNSPNLLTFVLYAGYVNNQSLCVLRDLLKKKFAHRQLVISGSLKLLELSIYYANWYEMNYNKYRSNCLFLWL